MPTSVERETYRASSMKFTKEGIIFEEAGSIQRRVPYSWIGGAGMGQGRCEVDWRSPTGKEGKEILGHRYETDIFNLVKYLKNNLSLDELVGSAASVAQKAVSSTPSAIQKALNSTAPSVQESRPVSVKISDIDLIKATERPIATYDAHKALEYFSQMGVSASVLPFHRGVHRKYWPARGLRLSARSEKFKDLEVVKEVERDLKKEISDKVSLLEVHDDRIEILLGVFKSE